MEYSIKKVEDALLSVEGGSALVETPGLVSDDVVSTDLVVQSVTHKTEVIYG